ncbi:MAG: aldo/keto reductase [Erysipelotrichaceae bacterium]|nr:aldo/keto reductase [Erysipelotrichaceae bacterium]
MKTIHEVKTTRNGINIPVVGFGTWQIPNEAAYEAVSLALKNGYRHIDTAAAYGNEEAVGRAIKDSGIPRKDLFITSKLQAQIKGYDEALVEFEKTITKLGVDYLDLYLIHAPWPWDQIGKDCTQGNIDSWKAFEKLYKEGKIKTIGVSNFAPKDIQALIDTCEIVPFVNQISYWIGHTQKETVSFCDTHKILIEAYSPLATGKLFKNEKIVAIANKLEVSVARLAIKYCVQKGTIPLPKSTHEARMIENADLEFKIPALVMAELDQLDR